MGERGERVAQTCPAGRGAAKSRPILPGRIAGRPGAYAELGITDSSQQNREVQLWVVLVSPWRPPKVSCASPLALLCQGFGFLISVVQRG